MKLITKDTDYAIRALCVIAESKKRVFPVKELVRLTGVPRAFLRKILQSLSLKGIVTSCKGKGGGFSLAGDPHVITINDLIEVFQGPVRVCLHTLGKKECPKINKCRLKREFDTIERELTARLRSITIASLLK